MNTGDNTNPAKFLKLSAASAYHFLATGAPPVSTWSNRLLMELSWISSSTSANSSSTPMSLDIDKPSLRSLAPKTTKSMDAKNCVNLLEMREGNACPTMPDKMVITTSDEKAAVNTTTLDCFIAIKAAMRNVLSPISETTIIETDMMKES